MCADWYKDMAAEPRQKLRKQFEEQWKQLKPCYYQQEYYINWLENQIIEIREKQKLIDAYVKKE